MNCSKAVKSVWSVRRPSVALAMPKSITFGMGTPSWSVTRMLDGLRSRWMMPFWCACWIAWQTCENSSSRWAVDRLYWSQKSVILTPRTSSMTKNGRPASVAPASRILAMFGWSIIANAWRSASNRAMTSFVSIPSLMIFSATRRCTGSSCSAIQTTPQPPSPSS